MSVTNYSQLIYDNTGRNKPSHHVYAAFGEFGGKLVCKIGYSGQLQQRLYTLARSGGVPITFAKALTAYGLSNARQMEAMLHTALARYRDHHEWFLFDPKRPEDKEQFKLAWGLVGRSYGAIEIAVDVDELREYGIQKQREHLQRVRRKGKVSKRWRSSPR